MDPVDLLARPPRNVGEALRVAHALMYNCDEPADRFLVMSTRFPMYWVKGACQTLEEAQALFESAVPVNPYLAVDEEKLAIIELETTGRMRMSAAVNVCWHDCFTEWFCPLFGQIEIRAADVESYSLTVNFKAATGKPPLTIPDIPRSADLISLRHSALERFIYPQYESSLGRMYTDRLRERMNHDGPPQEAV